MRRDKERRPGGESPERLERESMPATAAILRRSDRNSPRDARRAALLAAMGAPPPWRRLGEVVLDVVVTGRTA